MITTGYLRMFVLTTLSTKTGKSFSLDKDNCCAWPIKVANILFAVTDM